MECTEIWKPRDSASGNITKQWASDPTDIAWNVIIFVSLFQRFRPEANETST